MSADEGAGFETKRKRTQRDALLDAMEPIVPWAALCALIEPYYHETWQRTPAD
ncbi:MAG: IS5/IS1182 family transposase, partial [Burkholderia sp.]